MTQVYYFIVFFFLWSPISFKTMPKSYTKNIATYILKVAQEGPEYLAELYGIFMFSMCLCGFTSGCSGFVHHQCPNAYKDAYRPSLSEVTVSQDVPIQFYCTL